LSVDSVLLNHCWSFSLWISNSHHILISIYSWLMSRITVCLLLVNKTSSAMSIINFKIIFKLLWVVPIFLLLVGYSSDVDSGPASLIPTRDMSRTSCILYFTRLESSHTFSQLFCSVSYISHNYWSTFSWRWSMLPVSGCVPDVGLFRYLWLHSGILLSNFSSHTVKIFTGLPVDVQPPHHIISRKLVVAFHISPSHKGRCIISWSNVCSSLWDWLCA